MVSTSPWPSAIARFASGKPERSRAGKTNAETGSPPPPAPPHRRAGAARSPAACLVPNRLFQTSPEGRVGARGRVRKSPGDPLLELDLMLEAGGASRARFEVPGDFEARPRVELGVIVGAQE